MNMFRFNLDTLGVCASSLCMIHCLVFPALLLVMPLVPVLGVGQADECSTTRAEQSEACLNEDRLPTEGDLQVASLVNAKGPCCTTPTDFWIHAGLLAAVAPVGLIAWGVGYRRHGFIGVLLLGGAGVALLTGALLFGHQLFYGRGEQVMTVAGSICMVTAHLWNRQKCRCCQRGNIATIESQPEISSIEGAQA